jgi:hypothetical protein
MLKANQNALKFVLAMNSSLNSQLPLSLLKKLQRMLLKSKKKTTLDSIFQNTLILNHGKKVVTRLINHLLKMVLQLKMVPQSKVQAMVAELHSLE